MFRLPTPSVTYDFLSIAIAFSTSMPQVTGEKFADGILADLFWKLDISKLSPGSVQRQRIKNEYTDWQKITSLSRLNQLYNTCHEESCLLWKVDPFEIRVHDSDLSKTNSEPLLIQFWLWLMGGWKTCFSFEVHYNPQTESSKDDADSELILVYAELLVHSSYHVDLSIERDSATRKTTV